LARSKGGPRTVESRKRAAEAKGICIDSADIEPDRKTVAIYDRLATFYGPNITHVSRDTARIKSIMRELMSRSRRSLLTYIATTLYTGFVEGVWKNKPKKLLPGAELAHKIVEKCMGIPMKPRGGHLILNTVDDTGRYVFEGVLS